MLGGRLRILALCFGRDVAFTLGIERVFSLFGLGWGTAWPLFVIAAGLSFMVRGYPNDPKSVNKGTGTPPGL